MYKPTDKAKIIAIIMDINKKIRSWKDRLTSPCILSSVWERKMKEIDVEAVRKNEKA